MRFRRQVENMLETLHDLKHGRHTFGAWTNEENVYRGREIASKG